MNVPHKFRRCAVVAEQGGFFRALPRHGVAYFPRGPRLVVTFDNMKSRDLRGPRFPWGYQWLMRRGDSHLGVMMARRNDWFRHGALFDVFDDLAGAGFFAQFAEVVFYGSSMGGYGALAFSVAAPGARVVAMVPQTSLDPAVVPWEARYQRGFERGDWADRRYADGAAARNVTLIYDPFSAADHLHAARLPDARHFQLPFAGHRVGRHLLLMGALGAVAEQLIEGRISLAEWRALARGRHQSLPWCRALVAECLARDKPLLAQRVVDWIHDAQEGWHIPRLEREVRAARG